MFCTPEMVDQKLLALRTGFFAKVISTDRSTATIQPLNKVQSIDGTVQAAAVITNVPIIESARHKIVTIQRTCMINGNNGCTFSGTIQGQSEGSLSNGTCQVSVQMGAEGQTVTASGTAAGTANGNVTGTCSGDVHCTCSTETRAHLALQWIQAGDTVYCLCGDRDVTHSKAGASNTPSNRHHDISDAVIIGLM